MASKKSHNLKHQGISLDLRNNPVKLNAEIKKMLQRAGELSYTDTTRLRMLLEYQKNNEGST